MQEIHKDRLRVLADDSAAIAALRELFGEQAESLRPEVLETDTNELLGEKYRAFVLAERLVERTFNELNSYKVGRERPAGPNRAI